MSAKLIRVSEGSSEQYFTLDDAVIAPQYDYVNWEVQLEHFDAILFEVESLGLAGHLPSHWQHEMLKFRQELALAECKAFYSYCLDERSLPSEVGAHAEAMLLDILVDHSVAQCYQAIKYAAMRTLDFKTIQRKNNVTIHHYKLPSYMVSACQNYVNRARTEGLNNMGFARSHHLPRSMISFVLYDILLKMGDRGFTEPYNSAITSKIAEATFD